MLLVLVPVKLVSGCFIGGLAQRGTIFVAAGMRWSGRHRPRSLPAAARHASGPRRMTLALTGPFTNQDVRRWPLVSGAPGTGPGGQPDLAHADTVPR